MRTRSVIPAERSRSPTRAAPGERPGGAAAGQPAGLFRKARGDPDNKAAAVFLAPGCWACSASP
ncbi:hypothetical protein NKH77_48135 [Streptomyces sp. M19]